MTAETISERTTFTNCLSCSNDLTEGEKFNSMVFCATCSKKVIKEKGRRFDDSGLIETNMFQQEKSQNRIKRSIDYQKYFNESN